MNKNEIPETMNNTPTPCRVLNATVSPKMKILGNVRQI